MHKESKRLAAFTIVEIMIVVSTIAILTGIATFTAATVQKSTRDSARDAQVKIIANSLEKYYRDNGEYPSVAAMTSSNVETVRQKLGVSRASVFKLPLASTAVTNSIATSGASTTTVVYSANTTDPTKNSQCQTDANGYCDGFTMAYVKEVGGATQTVQSIHATFDAIKIDCDPGDSQSGNTCTHTYAGTYQAGAYTCPSGGTLSGTTCTYTYGASYATTGTYSCPTGEAETVTTCREQQAATETPGAYYCPNGGSVYMTNLCGFSATSSTIYSCPHSGSDSMNGQGNCRHERPAYQTQTGCQNAGYTWGGSACFNVHSPDANTNYSCPNGTSLYQTSCTYMASQYPTTYSCPSGWTLQQPESICYRVYNATYTPTGGYYYCSSGGSLSGTTCTGTYAATQGAGYYTCPSGGTASGSTCSYTYQLQS